MLWPSSSGELSRIAGVSLPVDKVGRNGSVEWGTHQLGEDGENGAADGFSR